MYKILITSKSNNGDLQMIVVEFEYESHARGAVKSINDRPSIMNGYVSQYAQLLF